MAEAESIKRSVRTIVLPVGNRGLRTRLLLILATAFIITGTTLVSLLAIRRPIQSLVVENVSSDLLHSVATFESMQAQQLASLDRENALLADLPSLKALMTTSDQRTIEDGAIEFWRVSGEDLFALADGNGRIMAAYVTGSAADPGLREELHSYFTGNRGTYTINRKGLFGCSVRPLYFGTQTEGTILGYVISGFAIDHRAVQQLSRATSVEAAFESNDRILASSLTRDLEANLASSSLSGYGTRGAPFKIALSGEHYLAVSRDLPSGGSTTLRLLELKSLDQEEQSIREIDRLVLLAGGLALALGSVLMIALSRFVTRPLEELADGVRAFAIGDSAHLLPSRGTREVRELSAAFGGMRREILQANQALLESERLATIGRMASSVSHDLRHYLAAVYANSEFLASGKLTEAERTEILGEVRSAVNGTTELLESLLVFSRSGPGIRRTHQFVSTLIERALSMVHVHPDAFGVLLTFDESDAAETGAVVDGKQVERALYNLILNACQAPRPASVAPAVAIKVRAVESGIMIDVIDNGDGVPAGIRNTLFEPFVSEGKQKGSGLGLTLTQCIATEHGGSVVLVSSRSGETIFRMSIGRAIEHISTSTLSRSELGTL
jgi:signal transduction histidine kinase